MPPEDPVGQCVVYLCRPMGLRSSANADLGLTPAQLANQVQKQMRRQIAKYYDSCMRSDDELQLQESRNISSRSQVCLSKAQPWAPEVCRILRRLLDCQVANLTSACDSFLTASDEILAICENAMLLCRFRIQHEFGVWSLRVDVECLQGDSGPGSLQWDPKSTVQLSQIYPEASLYRQIAHYGRLLNPDQALLRVKDTVKREDAAREMATIRPALEAASACVAATQSKASYRWVTMRDVCV